MAASCLPQVRQLLTTLHGCDALGPRLKYMDGAQGRALSLGGAIQRKRRQPPDPEPEVGNGMEDLGGPFIRRIFFVFVNLSAGIYSFLFFF